MKKMRHDIMLADGTYRRLGGKYRVRIDLSELSPNELNHLRLGAELALTAPASTEGHARCWEAPEHAVEVFIEKRKK